MQLLQMLAAVSFAEARTPQPGSFRQRRGDVSRTGSEDLCLWLQPALLSRHPALGKSRNLQPHFSAFNTWEMLFHLGVVVRIKVRGDRQGAWPLGKGSGRESGSCVCPASWSVLLRVHPHDLRDGTGRVRQAWGWSGKEWGRIQTGSQLRSGLLPFWTIVV